MHGHQQATAPAGTLPPVAAAATPSHFRSDHHPAGAAMRVDLFLDPVSGWTCWIPRWPAEAVSGAEEDPPTSVQRRAGQGLLVRLLGRVGAWFGICEQIPSGAWRRIDVPRRDPWEPGARHTGTIWSWWF